jgi:hypothetical protein
VHGERRRVGGSSGGFEFEAFADELDRLGQGRSTQTAGLSA